MRLHRLVPALLVALLGCAGDAEPPGQTLPPSPADARAADLQEPDFDADNLLNLAYGASVVSRTGEVNLDSSAAGAIDGVASSRWISPPWGRDQRLVYAFAAPSRVSRLGVTTPVDGRVVPAKVSFERSSDGRTWHPAGEVLPKDVDTPQLFDVEPFTALYLRVTVDEPSEMYSYLRSVHAVGQELEPPAPRSVAGCWRVNGFDARFEQDGARVAGVIATVPPTFVEGGTDGRVVRAVWLRGPMWGHAVVTATPDGQRLTGLEIHEDIKLQHLGSAWFGERCGEGAGPGEAGDRAPLEVSLPSQVLARADRWPLFALAFGPDDRLHDAPSGPALDSITSVLSSSPSQRFRVVAHEVREATPEQNRRRTDARIASIRAALQARGVDLARIEFVSAGSDWKGPTLSVALQRLLASRVALER